MWSPANKSALPTPEELNKAKEAINSVQKDLENAMESLVRAQLRVDILRKDVEERKAWVAPVRRLTFDALSMIFDWCADIEWDSAVRIAAVCRTWRSIALDTPRAWSFVELASKTSNQGIKMFFERSRERPLYVYLPGSRRFDLTSVAQDSLPLLQLHFSTASSSRISEHTSIVDCRRFRDTDRRGQRPSVPNPTSSGDSQCTVMPHTWLY